MTPDDAALERVVDALMLTAMGDYDLPMSEFYKAARAAIAAMEPTT